MKKIFTHLLLIAVMLVAGMSTSYAQAKIEFDKLTNNFGTFSESNPVQKCTFTFTNKGDKPLIINQAVASCGRTVPTYTKTPIMPGGKGVVSVTYNGKGKFLATLRRPSPSAPTACLR